MPAPDPSSSPTASQTRGATGALLDGRTAVVTGAARGIGRTVAERYLAAGASVALADVAGAEATAGELAASYPDRVVGLTADVTDPGSVQELRRQVVQRFGGVDVVVANAGILLLKPALEIGLDEWRRVLDVNLTGAFVTCQELGRQLVEQGRGGRIILSSSLFGLRGGKQNAAYSASKFGMIGLMQCLAAELAPQGITVNAVCPGQVDTPMIRQLFEDRAALSGRSPADVEGDILSTIPLGRLAGPQEIADVYVYLASSLSSYVTAQSLVVDGGCQVGW
jgi:NAD(P)-dependent dehydrogenase (short-subunit alcohol dehydrogenase family)